MSRSSRYWSWKDIQEDDTRSFKKFLVDTSLLGSLVLGFIFLVTLLIQRVFKFVVSVVMLLCTVPFYFLSYLFNFLFFKYEYNADGEMSTAKKRFKVEVAKRLKGTNRFLISMQEDWN